MACLWGRVAAASRRPDAGLSCRTPWQQSTICRISMASCSCLPMLLLPLTLLLRLPPRCAVLPAACAVPSSARWTPYATLCRWCAQRCVHRVQDAKPGVFGTFVNVIVAALTALHGGLKSAGSPCCRLLHCVFCAPLHARSRSICARCRGHLSMRAETRTRIRVSGLAHASVRNDF